MSTNQVKQEEGAKQVEEEEEEFEYISDSDDDLWVWYYLIAFNIDHSKSSYI